MGLQELAPGLHPNIPNDDHCPRCGRDLTGFPNCHCQLGA